jgi:seryl-tRNA synthetase
MKVYPKEKQRKHNVVERTGGVIPELAEDSLPHWELAKKYDLIEFILGVKITGADFRCTRIRL